LGTPKKVTSTKKGAAPYDIVVGGVHLLVGILLLSLAYRYPGTPPLSQKKELY
jgi:hypothetical protein